MQDLYMAAAALNPKVASLCSGQQRPFLMLIPHAISSLLAPRVHQTRTLMKPPLKEHLGYHVAVS